MDQKYTQSTVFEYDAEKEAFASLSSDGRIYAYIDLPAFRSMPSQMAQRRTNYVSRIVSHCARINVGGMLPRLRSHSGMNDDGLQILRGFYKKLLKCASETSVSVGFAPEHAYQEYLLKRMPKERTERMSSTVLVMYEYLCDADCTVKYQLHTDGTLMSLVAFDDEKLQPETIDLRHLVQDGVLVWTPETSGNCTDAGTSLAANKCKKLPVYAVAPINAMMHTGLILSVIIICRRVSLRSRKNSSDNKIKLKIAVSAQEMTVKLTSSTAPLLI